MARPLPDLPDLGPGVIYFAGLEPIIEENQDLVRVVEIEPQTLWFSTPGSSPPYRKDEAAVDRIKELPGARLLHSVGNAVGGSASPDVDQAALVGDMAVELRSPWVSEHLSFNRVRDYDGDFATGFMLPLRQTDAGIAIAAAAIEEIARHIDVPIAVETPVNYLRPRRDEMPDGAFIAEVSEEADCGILLDLHNVWTNELNGRQPLLAFLDQIPLDRVWEVHLAGGFEHRGYWLDAHSGAVPETLLELAGQVLTRLPNLHALIYELTPSAFPTFGIDAVRQQLLRLQSLWDLRGSTSVPTPCSHVNTIATHGDPLPAVWERTLGELVIGKDPGGELASELASDPGVGILRDLVREVRASTIVSTLRLVSRLLLLALGQETFEDLLARFECEIPPELFASEEAARFAGYLRSADLEVAYLPELLAFEEAVLATLMDGRPRSADFSFEPISVLRALSEGRRPGPPSPGRFRIEVTGEDVVPNPQEYPSWSNYWPH